MERGRKKIRVRERKGGREIEKKGDGRELIRLPRHEKEVDDCGENDREIVLERKINFFIALFIILPDILIHSVTDLKAASG